MDAFLQKNIERRRVIFSALFRVPTVDISAKEERTKHSPFGQLPIVSTMHPTAAAALPLPVVVPRHFRGSLAERDHILHRKSFRAPLCIQNCAVLICCFQLSPVSTLLLAPADAWFCPLALRLADWHLCDVRPSPEAVRKTQDPR